MTTTVHCEDCNTPHVLVFRMGRLTAKCPRKAPAPKKHCTWALESGACGVQVGMNNRSGLCRKHRALKWAKNAYHTDPAYRAKIQASNRVVKQRMRAKEHEAPKQDEEDSTGEICETCGLLFKAPVVGTMRFRGGKSGVIVPGCCEKPRRWT